MSKPEFLSAYTPPHREWPYGQVPFINISKTDDAVIFTVRRGGEHQIQFTPVEIAVPLDDAHAILGYAYEAVAEAVRMRDAK